MQKKIVYPALAVLLGGAGFALRRWELATAFEETGLVTPGMPATLSLIALSAVAGILCALLGWRRRGVDYGDYDTAFEAKDCPLYMGAVVLSAFFLLGAAVLKLMGLPTAYREAAALAAQGESGADHAVAHSDGGAERGGGDLCPSNRAKCLPGGADGEIQRPGAHAGLPVLCVAHCGLPEPGGRPGDPGLYL